MSRISDVISKGAAVLAEAGIDQSRRDAQILLADVCGCETSGLMLLDDVSTEQAARFHQMIEARAAFQPISQIIGYREFWGRRFRVTPDVLDPRPETETLIEQALKVGGQRILDLGTGSGAIALTLACELPSAEVTATDISDVALEIARENAVQLGAERVNFLRTDWWDGLSGAFDLIVSNPPYITASEMEILSPDVKNWEPHLALTPGGDGLNSYRQIAAQLSNYLAPGGTALFEIGHEQGAAVSEIFLDAGCSSVQIFSDLGGRDRVVAIKCQNRS